MEIIIRRVDGSEVIEQRDDLLGIEFVVNGVTYSISGQPYEGGIELHTYGAIGATLAVAPRSSNALRLFVVGGKKPA